MATKTAIVKTVKFRNRRDVFVLSKQRRATGYEVEQTTVTEEGQPDKVTVRNLAICEHFTPGTGWVKTTTKSDREAVYKRLSQNFNLRFI